MDAEREIDSMRREIAELKREIALMRTQLEQQPKRQGAGPSPRQQPTAVPSLPRRGLLIGGLGAAVGAAASVAGASSAAAATGNMQYGAVNLAGADSTVLNSSINDSSTLVVENTGFRGSGLNVVSSNPNSVGVLVDSAGEGIKVTGASHGVRVTSEVLGISVGGSNQSNLGMNIFNVNRGMQVSAAELGVVASGRAGGYFNGTDGYGVFGRAASTGSGVLAYSVEGPPLFLIPSQETEGLPQSGQWNAGSTFVSSDGSLWWCAVSGVYGDPSLAQPEWRLVSSPKAAGAFVPITPARVFDSRYVSGNGASQPAPLVAGSSRVINVRDSYIPNSATVDVIDAVPAGATAAAVNVTITGPTAGGYLYVGPGDTPTATASSINWTAPLTTIANGLVVPFGAKSRQLKIFTVSSSAGMTVQALIDVSGYYLGG